MYITYRIGQVFVLTILLYLLNIALLMKKIQTIISYQIPIIYQLLSFAIWQYLFQFHLVFFRGNKNTPSIYLL